MLEGKRRWLIFRANDYKKFVTELHLVQIINKYLAFFSTIFFDRILEFFITVLIQSVNT